MIIRTAASDCAGYRLYTHCEDGVPSDWSTNRLQAWVHRIPIRWRLTLVSLGLLTVLLSALGIVIFHC